MGGILEGTVYYPEILQISRLVGWKYVRSVKKSTLNAPKCAVQIKLLSETVGA